MTLSDYHPRCSSRWTRTSLGLCPSPRPRALPVALAISRQAGRGKRGGGRGEGGGGWRQRQPARQPDLRDFESLSDQFQVPSSHEASSFLEPWSLAALSVLDRGQPGEVDIILGQLLQPSQQQPGQPPSQIRQYVEWMLATATAPSPSQVSSNRVIRAVCDCSVMGAHHLTTTTHDLWMAYEYMTVQMNAHEVVPPAPLPQCVLACQYFS